MPFYYDATGRQNRDRGRQKKPEPPISRRRNPRGRSICMRANARLITAPGCTETPHRFGIKSQWQLIELSVSRAWARPSRLVSPAVPAHRDDLCIFASSVPITIYAQGVEGAAAASPLGIKPRQLNPEIRKCCAGQQQHSPLQSFSAPRCGGIGRDRASARQLCQSADLQHGCWQHQRQLFAVRAFTLAAPLVCRPVPLARQHRTAGDEHCHCLMLAPLFIWFGPDKTRKELTDFVGEKVA